MESADLLGLGLQEGYVEKGWKNMSDLPRENELGMGIVPETGQASFDMGYEGWCLSSLKVCDEPLCFIDAAGRPARPDAVAADYNQMVGLW